MVKINTPNTIEEANDLIKSGLLLGTFDNLNPEVYHAAGPALSKSGATEFRKSPAIYRAYLDGEYSRREVIGTLNHMRTLERKRFDETVVSVENRMSKENKAKIAEAEAAGKFVCTVKEYDTVSRMSDAILADEEAKELLNHKSGKAEQSHFAMHPEFKCLLKCRTDWLVDLGSTFAIGDLKYFDDLSDKAIEDQFCRMLYDWQCWYYLFVVGLILGRQSNFFKNIFVMSKPPYLVRCVMIDDEWLDRARIEMEPTIKFYSDCLLAGMWPGHQNGTLTLKMPQRVLYREVSYAGVMA